MRIKRYLLLAPILFAALLAVLAAGYFYEEDRALGELQSAQKEQALLRDTMLALVNEQSQSVKYIFENLNQDAARLNEARAETNKAAQALISGASKGLAQGEQLMQSIKDIRANVEKYNPKLDASFFTFFERINTLMSQNYANFADKNLPSDAKIFAFALSSFYDDLAELNFSRAHVARTVASGDTLSKDGALKWLNFIPPQIKFNLPALGVLGEINALNQSEKSAKISNDLRAMKDKISALTGKISYEDIVKIDEISKQKFLVFLEAAGIAERGFKEVVQKERLDAVTALVILSLAALCLIYCAVIAYLNFADFSRVKAKLAAAKNEILSGEGSLTDEEIVENLAAFYRNIAARNKKMSAFENIKNTYLCKLADSYERIYAQNRQMLALLRESCSTPEQIRAINILEENNAFSSLNYENIKNVLQIENKDLALNLSFFNPQITFQSVLESKAAQAAQKQVNYVTFLDPRLNRKLEGDESKICVILFNVINAALSQCNQFSKLVVEIKSAANSLRQDAEGISVSVRNNANAMSEARVAALLDPSLKCESASENLQLYVSIADMYLKLMGSKISISAAQGAGNEFSFVLRLGAKGEIEKFSVDGDALVGYVNDASAQYNRFMNATLEGLGVRYETLSNAEDTQKFKKYALVIMRESNDANATAKNLVWIKDPLTPARLASKLSQEAIRRSLRTISAKPQILIYDPNEAVLEMIKYAFSGFDAELTCASGYEKALSEAANKKFGAIFADSGTGEDLSALKRNAQNSATPMVAMFSNTSGEAADARIFAERIKKPINPEILGEILGRFIKNFGVFVKKEGELIKSREILLCKKSSIENKIFEGALLEFKGSLTVAQSFGEALDLIGRKPFGLALIDEDCEGFELGAFTGALDSARAAFNADIKAYVFSDEALNFGNKKYVKILSPSVSKAQLSKVVKQEFGYKSKK